MEEATPIAYINGKRWELPPGRAESTLLQFLREIGLTGAKLGCGEGGCGACTVMLSSMEADGSLTHRAVNACLCPLYAVEGMHVVTVEGIGNSRDGLHPVQARLAAAHGSQCGFCTPGFVMSMYALLRSSAAAHGGPPTEEEIEEALAGNLCRCTGYRPILDAFKAFAKSDPAAYTDEAIAASRGETLDASGAPTDGSAAGAKRPGAKQRICPSSGQPCTCAGEVDAATGDLVSSSEHKHDACGPLAHSPARPSSEPIFPPELRRRRPAALALPGPTAAWYRPADLAGLLALKRQYPEAKLVVGNTEVGIEMKFKHARYPVLVAPTHVPELNAIHTDDAGVTIGAAVTLTRVLHLCQRLCADMPPHQTSALAAVAEQLRWFAGPPIRNAASLGGNIATASPISDLNPLWMAAGAVFTLAGEGTGERQVPASQFFLGYRKTALQPHEILCKVFVPWTHRYEYVKEFKQAHRRDDDIAIVNAGMRFRLRQGRSGTWEIGEASIAYGGVAPVTIPAPSAAAALTGRPLDQAALKAGLEALSQDVQLSPNAPGGQVEFRASLASSFLFKGLLWVAQRLEADAGPGAFVSPFPARERSAAQPYSRPPASGLQYFSQVPGEQVVGQPYRHLAADQQVSGEAQYVDDIHLPANALHAALVLSTRPHARLVAVDTAPAACMPGVAGVFTAADVPGLNSVGPVAHDEELFAEEVVTCVGHPIAVVVADTEAQARAAARAVVVEYDDLPAVLDIDDALEAGSFITSWKPPIEIACGDAAAALAGCEHVLEGEVRMGGQEHFYLEPNACVVIPGEAGELLTWSSTQNPDHHQRDLARVLGVPQHRIVVKTKRIGGGFGGKESRPAMVNCCAAVPAALLRRPVRLVLDRDEDMQIMGTRHPFMARYRVGFTSEGKLQALEAQLYANAGNSLDLSHSIVQRSLLLGDNTYKTPHVDFKGFMCKTNQASNTAFRGFGGPQGMMMMEQIIDRVAAELGKPHEEVAELNMYQEGETTHYGQVLEGCQARPCWEGVMASSDYGPRAAAVAEYNAQHRYRKRGLAAIPTKFGISFTTKFLNQAGALVHLYRDGTVLVAHGGVEMGQGLHTKVAQVVAQALGTPLSAIHIAETSTDKVPNASPTAASASSDMYGAAAADACEQINARLAPFRAKLPGASLAQIAEAAYLERVDLCAHGFYATPDITGYGGNRPFNYFTYGAAVAEVELDTLTGDFQVLRADVCMDVGKSLNPAIDIGQVEGAFVQGMGWATIEELVWGDSKHTWVRPGQLHTRGPGTYKIPSANDIPIDFRVTLLRNSPCARTPMVHSSKAVGEPPFFLGASVFFALKKACYAARADAGLSGWFRLDSPATPEKLRMACADGLTAGHAPADLLPKASV